MLQDRDFGFVHQVLTFTREHPQAQSTFSKRFGTDYLGTLEHLKKYGRIFLNEEEFKRCSERSWEQYYRFLGSRALHGSDEGFWEFHKRQLARLDYRLHYGEVAKPVISELLDLVFNPLKTSKRIANKLAR